MHIIGITGGVGAGKSEIMKCLAEHYDVFIIKADDVGHEVLNDDKHCARAVVKLLGKGVQTSDGKLDRAKIAAAVYCDDDKLEQLNKILHPNIMYRIEKMIAEQRKIGRTYFFLEAALLLEANYDKICDEVWYIHASCEERRKRLINSRSYSEEKISAIMANQLAEAEFEDRCDFTVDNSGAFEKTVEQIRLRMQEYGNV